MNGAIRYQMKSIADYNGRNVAHGAALNDPVIEKTAAKYGVSKTCFAYDMTGSLGRSYFQRQPVRNI